MQERGFTLVPTRLYFKDGRAKVEVALAKGKDVRDRRREISKRESDRQIGAGPEATLPLTGQTGSVGVP